MNTKTRLILFSILILLLMGTASCAPETESVSTASPATKTVTRSPVPPEATQFAIWIPAPSTTWQWQLDTPVNISVDAAVFDIDLFQNDASVVTALHTKGAKVICYTSVGSREDWQRDANQFPKDVVGKDYPGWAGEKFLDIRQIDKLAPIMLARLDLCKQKGFDGIEPDNIDTYNTDTGFPLTYEDQLKYNRWLIEQAHARGLSIGMKNDGDQVKDLANDFDWALTEDCFDQNWCDQMKPFIQQGKAVFAAEYTDTGIALDKFCPLAKENGFSVILKNRNLDVFRKTCP